MLSLILQVGDTRYALEARHILEVTPLVKLQRIQPAPRGVAGLMNYRGEPVPVIDLSELSHGSPAERRLSTRIVLVRAPQAAGAPSSALPSKMGLLAERATETRRFSPGAFAAAPAGCSLGSACAAKSGANELIFLLDLPWLFGRLGHDGFRSATPPNLECNSIPPASF